MENIHSKVEEQSCTEVKALWPIPTKSKVDNVPVAEMNWGKMVGLLTVVSALRRKDIQTCVTSLQQSGCEAAVERVIEPFALQFGQPSSSKSIFDLYNPEDESKSLARVAGNCK